MPTAENLLTNGSADNIVNLGGIAGRNNAGGSISNSYVGFRDNTLIETDKDAKKAASAMQEGLQVGMTGMWQTVIITPIQRRMCR